MASPGSSSPTSPPIPANSGVTVPPAILASSGVTLPSAPTQPYTIQMMNIKSHVPATLDLTKSNYMQWCMFFDYVFDKFSIGAHVNTPPTQTHVDPDWLMIDSAIVNWMYTTISNEVLDLVMCPYNTAYDVWVAIKDLFHDIRLTCVVYLEAKFCSVFQGDMSTLQYCSNFKTLVDTLRDVGQPVHEENQVLNLLWGMNTKFRHAIPIITSKDPLPSLLFVRSSLLLEELQLSQSEKNVTTQALFTQHASEEEVSEPEVFEDPWAWYDVAQTAVSARPSSTAHMGSAKQSSNGDNDDDNGDGDGDDDYKEDND
ncbi:uncharacterized protein LOC133895169 [Phragmites australis]|uniref:uncharacterized protein LOC133895169 n=1 Tax=Phragmites australis TaxID=29695 RepID=UPI002D767318|nr:uncharacterized protein LOC133895169 [Phragmites australis]